MNSQKPNFGLARLAGEDAHQPPELVLLPPTAADAQINRRSFLGAGIGAAAAMLFLRFESVAALTLKDGTNSLPGASEMGVTVLGTTLDGKHFISVSDSDVISLWALPGGRLLHTRQADMSFVNAPLVIAPPTYSGQAQDYASQFMLLTLSGRLIAPRLRGRLAGDGIKAMTATPDGSTLACASGDRVEVWSQSDDRLLAERSIRGGASTLAVTPNGSRLAAACGDGTILEWDLAEEGSPAGGARLRRGDRGAPLVITREEQLLALAGGGDTASPSSAALETRGGRQLAQSRLQSLALTPDGETLLAGYDSGAILLWGMVQSRTRRRSRRGSSRRCRGCPIAPSRSRSRGGRITAPCTASPVPPGMICECNCVRVR